METMDGYGIQSSILFETGHGFALARNKAGEFMVWQFTETPFGRDFYHGHSFCLQDAAERDYRRRADDYGYLYKAEPGPRQKPARYCRYYSTQRPVDIGTYPKPDGNNPIVIVNYDCDRRRPVAGGRLSAWGELTYREPLPKEQADAYELAPAPDFKTWRIIPSVWRNTGNNKTTKRRKQRVWMKIGNTCSRRKYTRWRLSRSSSRQCFPHPTRK